MSLLPIVRTLGGILYDCGSRAVVPGPGHSPSDRSVSLRLSGGRLLVHSFGRSTWQEVFEDLRARNLVDVQGRPLLIDAPPQKTRSPAPATTRSNVARRIWSEAQPLFHQHAMTHVRRRRIDRPAPVSTALRHHSGLRQAVYDDRGPTRPALLAAVTEAEGRLCAVEITYLDPAGRRASDMTISRKVVGALPPGCAVRLDPPEDALLVGEGVFTVLSASARFAMPAWALLSTQNLRTWTPPAGVRRVLIAADRGAEGERSAKQLWRRLSASGLDVVIAWPPATGEDWNDLEADRVRGGRPEARRVEG